MKKNSVFCDSDIPHWRGLTRHLDTDLHFYYYAKEDLGLNDYRLQMELVLGYNREHQLIPILYI